MLLALGFVQGVASAAVQASGPGIVADAVPPERRGSAYIATMHVAFWILAAVTAIARAISVSRVNARLSD